MGKLIFIFVIFPFLVKSQVYQSGTILPYYYDINPDTLISYSSCHNCVISETASISMFGTTSVDFEIRSYSGNGLGGGSENITIIPMNTNVFVIYGRSDSVLANPWSTPYWWITGVAKPLSQGDTINKSNYSWSNTYLYLIQKDWGGGNYKNVTDFVSTNDKYIGVKYQTSTDTLYGWIRVQCPDRYNCFVKDFSSQKCTAIPSLSVTSSSSVICLAETVTLTASGSSSYTWSTAQNGASITASPSVTTTYTVIGTNSSGCILNSTITQSVSACIGIKEYQTQQISIYPNPTLNSIHISDHENKFQNSEIEITNYLGQAVLKTSFINTIDVSKLSQGIYTLKITTKESQSYYSKFVKE